MPIAPMVLKTFAMPTPAIHAGIAKTNMVLKVFLTVVKAVSASPIISVMALADILAAEGDRATYRCTSPACM